MKTPQQHIEFYKEQLQIFNEGYKYTLNNNDIYTSIFNSEQIFLCNLMIALIQWRLKENPKIQLIKTLRNLEENISALSNNDGYHSFQTTYLIIIAKYFAFLCDLNLNLDINNLVLQSDENKLDFHLYNLIEKPSGFNTEIEKSLKKISKIKRYKLAFDSYDNYFKILESFNSINMDSKIELAELLFTKRTKDSFYSNSHQIEGGNFDNDLVIDFRLAVILKKIQYGGHSIHKWEW